MNSLLIIQQGVSFIGYFVLGNVSLSSFKAVVNWAHLF